MAGLVMESGILSASSYPQAFMCSYDSDRKRSKRKAAAAAAGGELPCGLVFHAASSSASNENDLSSGVNRGPTERPRKRTRRSIHQDDDGGDDDDDDDDYDHTNKNGNGNHNGGSGRRQRGRPRLDRRDETAADRRRTQIRLAQRAYRHRKETAIHALKQRVVSLKMTIEEMHRAFSSLRQSLVRAGLPDDDDGRLVTKLQATTDQFMKLRQIVYEEDDEDEEAATQKLAAGGTMPKDVAPQPGSASKSRPNNDSHSALEIVPQMTATSHAEAGFAELTANADEQQHRHAVDSGWLGLQHDSMQFNVHVSDTCMAVDQTNRDDPMAFQAQLMSSSMKRSMNPLTCLGFHTYSFQETTFARRLQRLSMEKGYRILDDAQTDPALLKRLFRFSFCFSNRRMIKHRLGQVLQCRVGQGLENWSVPYLRIGGAGTHYPRRGKDGSAIYPPNLLSPERAIVSAKPLGPRAWVEVETPRAEGTTQEILDAIGFGGLWFDAHDVEQYLRTKGIYLDARSTYVEVDPSVIHPTMPTPLAHGSSGAASAASSITEEWSPFTTTATTATTPPPPASQPAFQAGNGGLEFAQDMYTPPEFGDPSLIDSSLMDTNHAPGFDESAEDVYNKQIWPWPNAPPAFPFESDYVNDDANCPVALDADDADSNRPRRPTLTLDVDKFLHRVSNGSACLGRAPGYRREMVDNALLMSLTEK